MTTLQKINHLREMGMNNTEISRIIGYSNSYVSGVRTGSVEAGKPFRRAITEAYKTITIESRKRAIQFQDDARYFAEENERLMKLVSELEAKLDEVRKVVNCF